MHRHIPTAILLLLMIVLFVAMDETLLPQLLTALAVDVGRQSGGIALRCGIRQLFHSTATAHSAAHKITALIETHAQRQLFCLLFWSWH